MVVILIYYVIKKIASLRPVKDILCVSNYNIRPNIEIKRMNRLASLFDRPRVCGRTGTTIGFKACLKAITLKFLSFNLIDDII